MSESALYEGGELATGYLPYIVIEGNSGVGKSSLLYELGRYGFPTVNEYHEFLDKSRGESFPQFPPPDVETLRRLNDVLLELVGRRLKEMSRSSPDSSSVRGQIVDRSVLSFIAFEFAKGKQGVPADLDELPRILLAMYEQGILREPHGYIYLHCSTGSIQDRREGKVLPFLVQPETIGWIDSFLRDFFSEYVPSNRLLDLDTDELPIEAIRQKAYEFVLGCFADPEPLQSMRNFLIDLTDKR